MKRVAVVGSGISGLAAAHALAGQARVTLFEAGDYFGGHTHTVDVTLDGVTHGVDTGFLVFNHRTYPHLVRLFAELGVETAPSRTCRFRCRCRQQGLEWSGSDLNTVFAQRRNLLRPRFLRMLADILRFNKLATALAERGAEANWPNRSATSWTAKVSAPLPRLVLPAHDRLHLVLPHRPDAALSRSPR
jgi:predicted NAD/FAD-binding protein